MAGAFIILFCVKHSLLQDVLCEIRVLFSKSELLISGTWIMNSHSVFALLIFSLLLVLFCVKCCKCKGSYLFWIWSNGLRFIKFKLALSNKLYMKLKSSLNGKKVGRGQETWQVKRRVVAAYCWGSRRVVLRLKWMVVKRVDIKSLWLTPLKMLVFLF